MSRRSGIAIIDGTALGEGAMKVRSWYGLSGEIEVENELWHLVKIGQVALNHPPVINLLLRRGLPRDDRLRLSYLHEFGHFQTLPFALAHALWMLWSGRKQPRSFLGWSVWLIKVVVAHEGVWEFMSEGYVIARDSTAYRETYRRTPNPLLPAFWVAMSGVGGVLTAWLLRSRD